MRIRRLAFNSRYLHACLKKLGFITYGRPFSPIVPLLIYNPSKMATFARMMRTRSTPIVVVVAYPAHPLVTSCVRFCVSAAHTKEDIDTVTFDLKHGHSERWPLEQIMKRSVELGNSRTMRCTTHFSSVSNHPFHNMHFFSFCIFFWDSRCRYWTRLLFTGDGSLIALFTRKIDLYAT